MKTIIVLGMHRSGTSAITRAIGQLGAEMGPESRMRKNWENLPLRHFNDKLLGIGKGDWDAPPPAEWLELPEVRALVDEARTLMHDQFGEAPIAVWKDPRSCITMPFWLQVLDEAPVYLLIYRHPSEVAASLEERNSFGIAHSYAVWERYNADALRAVAGRPTVVLEFGKVIEEPVESLELICNTFAAAGVILPNDPATADHGLVAQERHHTVEAPNELDDIATSSQQQIMTILRSLDGGHPALELPSDIPDPHPLSLALLSIAAKLRAMKRARKRTVRERSKTARTHGTAAVAEAPPPIRKPSRPQRQARDRPRQAPAGATDLELADPIETSVQSTPSRYGPRIRRENATTIGSDQSTP